MRPGDLARFQVHAEYIGIGDGRRVTFEFGWPPGEKEFDMATLRQMFNTMRRIAWERDRMGKYAWWKCEPMPALESMAMRDGMLVMR